MAYVRYVVKVLHQLAVMALLVVVLGIHLDPYRRIPDSRALLVEQIRAIPDRLGERLGGGGSADGTAP